MRRALWLAVLITTACGKSPPDPESLVRQLREGTAEQRAAAVEQLTALGDKVAPVLPEIEKAVLDDDPEVRRAAVDTLCALGADAKEGLIVALGDAEPDIRRKATESLVGLGLPPEKTIPHLTERLGDTDFKVVTAARRGLVEIGDAARPALARVVVKGEDLARDHALRALVEIGDASIPDLLAAAQAHNAAVRRAVLESLIVMQAPPAVVLETFRHALGDDDAGVRDVAARAVQALGEAAAPAAPDLVPLLGDDDNAGPAQWALRDIGAKAVPSLVVALGDENATIRARAAQCLAEMPDHAGEAVDDLIHALGDTEASVRREVVATLGTLGPPEAAVEPLAQRLGDDDDRVSHRAEVALERVPDQARPAVQKIADGGGPGADRAKALLSRMSGATPTDAPAAPK